MNTRSWFLSLCCFVAISGCAGTDGAAPCEDATVLDDATADAAVAEDTAEPADTSVDVDDDDGSDADDAGADAGADAADADDADTTAADADTADAGPPCELEADCDDGDPCTVDACDTVAGVCVSSVALGAPCGVNGICTATGCGCPAGSTLENGACVVAACDPVGTQPMQLLETTLEEPGNPNFNNAARPPRNVVLRGDWLLVGWQRVGDLVLPPNTPEGQVRVYHHTGGGWALVQTLVSPIPAPTSVGGTSQGSRFGYDLTATADGSLLLVSDALRQRVDAFVRDAAGVYQHDAAASLVEPFGVNIWTGPVRLATDGVTLVVSTIGQGARIYRRTGPTWTLEATFATPPPSPPTWVFFGAGAVVAGDQVLISAPANTVNSIITGAIAVYQRDANGSWSFAATLQETMPYLQHGFGASMDVDGDTLAVGVEYGGCIYPYNNLPRGHVSMFKRTGNVWQPTGTIAPSSYACGDIGGFGRSLALSGDELYVAAPNTHNPETQGLLGMLFHYHRDAAGAWTLVDRPRPAGPQQPIITSSPLMWQTNFSAAANDLRQMGVAIDADGLRLAAWSPQTSLYSDRFSQTHVFDPIVGSATDDGVCICGPGYIGPDCAQLGCADASDCDDGDACTTDLCMGPVGALACVHKSALAECNDSDPCTTDTCNPATGCVHTALDCDDNSVCTTDACVPNPNPAKPPACSHVHVTDYSPCDDGSACWVGEQCKFGICMGGGPLDCDDGDVCTLDSCDLATDACLHTPTPGAICGGGGVCGATGCVCPPGSALEAGVCAVVICDPIGALPLQATSTVLPGALPTSPTLFNLPPRSTVLRGDWLFQGWQRTNGNSVQPNPAGRVMISHRVGGTWTQTQTLLSPAAGATGNSPAAPTTFGHDVTASPDGSLLLVSDAKERSVTAYLRDSAGVYAPSQALTLVNPFNYVINSTAHPMRLATDGVTLAVVAHGSQMRLLRRTGNSWTQESGNLGAPISQAAPYQWYWLGQSVAVQGDQVFVGSPGDSLSTFSVPGVVALYQRSAAGTWSFAGALNDDVPAVNQQFGYEIDVHGDTLAIGSIYFGTDCAGGYTPFQRGHVSIFHRGNNGAWTFEAKIASPDLQCGDDGGFGAAFALGDAQQLFVGAATLQNPQVSGLLGAIYRFHRGGNGWSLVSRLQPPAPLAPLLVLGGGFNATAAGPGANDWQRLGYNLDAEGSRVATWAPGSGIAGRADRTYVFDAIAGTASDAGACVCAPGYVGPNCEIQTCTAASQCDDGNPCTGDGCVTVPGQLVKQCSHTPSTAKAQPCDDGNICSSNDFCKAGVCNAGPTLLCDDEKFCTSDICNPATGTCTFKLIVGCKG